VSLLRALPPPAGALVVAVVLAGAAALAARAPAITSWSGGQLLAFAGLAAGLAASELLRMDLRFRRWSTDYSMEDALYAAALLLADPSVLVAAAAMGMLIGQGARSLAPLKVAFNVGQAVLAITAAESVFIALGAPPATTVTGWLAGALAMAALWAVNTAIMGSFVCLLEGKPLRRAALVPTAALLWLGNLAIGILAALLFEVEPRALPLLLVPTVLTRLAYKGWLDSAQERDWMSEMARDADRIARGRDLSGRVTEPHDGEAAELASTLNRLLKRIEDAFQRERRLIRETSHELRTPITICRGHLEVMSLYPPRAELDETVTIVLDELDRMTRIVEDMSTLARVEDPATLRSDVLDLDRLVADVAAKSAPLLADRLRIQPVPAGATLRADAHRLTQALTNLLKNAGDHTPPGTAIELRVLAEGGGWQFEIADQGGGLPAGQEMAIFRPFHAGAHSPGSGLGLAIVAGVARAHGGSAGVDNRPGEGATFWLRLPREEAGRAAAGSAATPPAR
jgi:signal transduction histidine kinase